MIKTRKIFGLVGLIGALSLNSCNDEVKKDMTLTECQHGNIRIVAEYHQGINSMYNDDYYTLKFYEKEANDEFYVGQLRVRDTQKLKGLFYCEPANQGKRMVVDTPGNNGIYTVHVNKNRSR